MKIFKIVICCLFLISNYQAVIANNKAKIQGNIFDGQTNTILPFVNVIVLNTDRGTMADASGHYELLLPAGSHELMFSMIGYKTLRQKIILIENQTLNCDVLLTPTVLYMPGVTIIAHKTAQQKQNESVSSLSFETKKIRDLPFSLNDVNRAL
ncbi:MAG TPA: carboxypeptidase-like regulatory domain-containing protein, partial [Candidatus Lokiarchaeia archaeon]